ncbi:hypothetical protein CPB97_011369 [Podila verticillata]|nr:hypothetical protein CPB97_011369 [Podila verticillata]
MSEKELLAQIAQVAGAINKHMNTPPASYYSGYAPRGGYNARGRGRGRGMPYSPAYNPVHVSTGAFNRKLTLNNTQQPPASTTPTFAPSPRPPVAVRQFTLVNNNNTIKAGDSSSASTPLTSPAVSPPASSNSAPPTPPVTPVSTPTPGQWIQTKTKNMSMMNPSTYQKTMAAKQNSIRTAKVAKLKMHQERAKKAADLRKGIVRVGDKVYSKSLDGRKLVMRDPNQEDIVINGATFQMDPRGNKLIRKIGTGSQSTISTTTPTTTPTFEKSLGATPKQFAVDGVVYVRTTSGNLVRATLVKNQLLAKRAAQEALKAKRNKVMARKRQFCKYFTRFGHCTNIRCPFMHSRQHLAICKRFLRGLCHYTDATCKLSHTPSPHSTPACSHFQYAACTKDKCLYPHIKVNAQAPICRPFAKEGWCEAGATCKDRHVWICPDFDTPKGCNVKCGLAHVANGGIKVKKTAEEIERDRNARQQQQQQHRSGPGNSTTWSGRYMDRTVPSQNNAATESKAREYDENFIPLDFDSADEEEGAMLQMQVDSHESAEDEDVEEDVEEEDVNSDVEMEEDGDEEEREEDMGEEEEEGEEEQSDGDGGFAAFEDDDDNGFYC